MKTQIHDHQFQITQTIILLLWFKHILFRAKLHSIGFKGFKGLKCNITLLKTADLVCSVLFTIYIFKADVITSFFIEPHEVIVLQQYVLLYVKMLSQIIYTDFVMVQILVWVVCMSLRHLSMSSKYLFLMEYYVMLVHRRR